MTAKQVVQDFCDLMVRRDAEALRPYLADDVVYQNAGMPASAGIDQVIDNMAGQFAMFPDSYEYRTINAVAEGEVVMNERLDMVKGPDGTVHGLPVMGAFVVRDGKIARWTDYWDSALIGKMMSGEDYAALVPAY
ncbi:nuclear transport factor 2 family protein [Acidiferrimicrobium sp. IK]|uniref:nuclear transport factor 2 family protein n=1 Tax=Acidiferrimicrobium sp. IK TaxID=2871700 RepID=UPI0021CB881E|nr:limonene-1,2-epoxide hydrolase family protein [Acidiferrimicrobium sp. IK]MCU4183258.1 nuclear transport factor 2 family protein [Acidiferrimicrobium sp. IK]